MSVDAIAEMPNQAPEPSTRQKIASAMNKWIGLDMRSLALFRVGLALVMLMDLYNRSHDVEAHYSDSGVLPRDEQLDKFMGRWILTFHLMTGQTEYVGALFALQAFFALWMLFGYRTRLAVFLCWIFTISLQGRQPMILQAGDVLYRISLFWAMFLPLNARCSIDRALGKVEEEPPTRLLTPATIAIMLQFFYVYAFVVLHRTHAVEWHMGDDPAALSAVYFATSIDHFSTPLGQWLSQYPETCKVFTFLTLQLEIWGPVLWLIPWGPTRLLACLSMMAMHVGFGVTLEVGMFVPISCATWLPLIPTWFWDKCEAMFHRRPRFITVYYDAASEARFKLLRVLKMLLMLRDAKLAPAQSDAEIAEALGERAWGVADVDGKLHLRHRALAVMFRASPFWFPLAPLAPVFYTLFSGVRATFLANRMHLRALRWRPTWINHVLATFFITYVTMWNIDTLQGKKGKPETQKMAHTCHWLFDIYSRGVDGVPTKHTLRAAHSRCKRLAWLLRIDQRWNMFSPYPMKGDGWFLMAGMTRGKKEFDLWRELYPGVPAVKPEYESEREDGAMPRVHFEKPVVASTWYPGQRWRKFLMNLRQKKHEKYRLYLGRWLCRTYNRGKKSDDRLATFHWLYMTEYTKLYGHKPTKCITLWRHFCTDRAKKSGVTPSYETTCKLIRPPKTDKQKEKKPDVAAKPKAQ